MNRGYEKIYICIEDNFLWRTNEPYCKRAAWMDLILLMNHAENDFNLGNRRIVVQRGQYWTSIGKLGARWKWGEKKVRAFLDLLVESEMIYKESTNQGIMLTVRNYSKYQDWEGNRGKQKAEQKTSEGRTDGLPTDRATDLPTDRQTIMNKNDIKNDIKNESKNEKKPAAHFFVEV